MQDIMIVGMGNTLRSDDGVGVRALEELHGFDLPERVAMFAAGTATSDLLHVIANCQKVIAVDAIQGIGPPGSVCRLRPEDVGGESQAMASAHQMGLLEALELAGSLGCAPHKVVIFGVEPKVLDWGPDLSPEVAAAVPILVRLVVEEACG